MEIRTNEPMARHTSFRVGGPADRFVIPESETELREAVLDCKKSGQPWYMIGNGSNLLVGDKGFRGTIISTERLAELEVQKNENIIIAGAGVMLSKLANTAAREELTGLEFAAGIPGTVGGAVMMNAGAYGSEMKNVLLWADVMDQDGSYNQDQLGLAQDIVANAGSDYTQLLLSEDLYHIAAQISGTPTAFFVDSTGNQVGYAYSGAMDQEQWSQILDEVLAEVQE